MNSVAPKSAAITVAIVEDMPKFSRGLVKAFESTPNVQCLGVCQTTADARVDIPVWRPDVVLLDIDLGAGRDGLEILPELSGKLPGTKILVLTVLDDAETIFQAVMRGAHGYLLKSTPLAELLPAIQEVHEGHFRLSPGVLHLILEAFRNPPPATDAQSTLSPREAEILELLAQGYDRKEIAARLNLGVETIKTHIRNIHNKLCVSTTNQAIAKVYPKKRFWLIPRWICGGRPV